MRAAISQKKQPPGLIEAGRFCKAQIKYSLKPHEALLPSPFYLRRYLLSLRTGTGGHALANRDGCTFSDHCSFSYAYAYPIRNTHGHCFADAQGRPQALADHHQDASTLPNPSSHAYTFDSLKN